MPSMTRTLLCCLAVLCLAIAPAVRGAQSDPALAGQTVTIEIPGGQQTREYAANGRLIYETIEREIRKGDTPVVEAIEREWLDDGTPLRDQTFVGGTEMRGTAWYMNGGVKEKRLDQSIREPGGMPGTYVERYSDLGVLQSAGVYQGRFRPVGVHRQYDEKGELRREITYGPDGVMVSERSFGADSAPAAGVRYFPDGSRRLDGARP